MRWHGSLPHRPRVGRCTAAPAMQESLWKLGLPPYRTWVGGMEARYGRCIASLVQWLVSSPMLGSAVCLVEMPNGAFLFVPWRCLVSAMFD